MQGGSALSDLRVIEYSAQHAGSYCARLLADAGSDVVKIEPPSGDAARRRGPFPNDIPDPDWSGLHLYLNANKRSVTLDLEQHDGASVLRELLKDADILVVNDSTPTLERLNLRRHHLEELNPRLIVTAITPFGLTGPYRDYIGDDLIAVSAGAFAYASPGIPDLIYTPDQEPPLRANESIGEYLAGIQGAVATMAAIMNRQLTGQGCEVDVSHQEAVAMVMAWDVGHASYIEPKPRAPVIFGAMPNAYLPCKDGYVVVAAFLEHQWGKVVEMMGNPDWAHLEVFSDPMERARNWDALRPLMMEWTLEYTGTEISRMARKNGVPCFPAYTVGQMVESEHVKERDYLRTLEGPDGRTFKLPGFPVRMGATPWHLRRQAPRLGEHTEEVLQEWLGLSKDTLEPLKGAGRAMTNRPLQGIRIVDFGQIIAIPFAAQILGWLGAEVILVESSQRMTNRTLPPFADGIAGVNRSVACNLMHSNKLSLVLNLRSPEGLDLAKRVISISDVVMENFATGTIERLGLGYEEVRQIKPDIVYLSMGAFGRSGPMKDFVGFHSVINAFSGLAAATGYPGGHPRILGGIFPDPLSGSYCILSVLQALYHRSTTGQGQYIEVAMTEALTAMMPEAVADYTMNGREAERVGNRDKDKAPHNVYRCKGDQKWAAISVSTDTQWESLCRATGHREWAADPRFADAATRWAHQDALDPLIEAWTQERKPYEVMETLQRAGVPAAPALDSLELLRDPHLIERDFLAWIDHPETGRRPIDNVAWKIDGARPTEYPRAPLLAEHNTYVLEDLLNLPKRKIQRLTEAGALV